MDEIAGWDGRNGPSLYWSILRPWVDEHSAHVDWLKAFGERQGSPVPDATTEDIWDLYSISRINDFLLQNFQPGNASWHERKAQRFALSLDEYLMFVDALGLRVVSTTKFTPLLHEIVEVSPTNDTTHPISLSRELWPALMLGSMIFSRSGTAVEGGGDHVVKEIAENSTLFWAWLRCNRPALDLSQGWGSNSQWRTRFRRDYL
ncbi:MAG: hypothetical protein ABUS57_05440, partial [Pseudomonadota bacterium]